MLSKNLVEIPILKKQASFEEEKEDNFYTLEQPIELFDYFSKKDAFFDLPFFSCLRKSEADNNEHLHTRYKESERKSHVGVRQLH